MKDDLKNTLQAILWGGVAAGTVDMIAATASGVGRGRAPLDGWRFVASGLIGKGALEGGWVTGVLGLLVHYGLTTIMAMLFVLAAKRRPELLRSSWVSGLLYGALIFAAMNYVIVPHSAVPVWKTPQGFWANLNGAMVHGLFVAVPIASIARHFLGQEQRFRTPLRMRASEDRQAA